MLHTITSKVLTGTNPCINKAIHVLLINGFAVLRISILGLSQNLTSSSVTCTKANVISWCQNGVIIRPGSDVFKTSACNLPFCTIIGTGKKNFSKHFLQSFQVKECFYAIIVIKHDSLSGSGFNSSLEAQQMLRHNTYIFIAIVLDETSILVAVHFSMKNIYQSCDLGHAVGWRIFNISQ